MADFDLNAKRAFVRAADQARQNATPAACEGCKNGTGQVYVFHFARKTGQTTSGAGDTQIITTSYADISARAVSLCDACVAQYQQAKRKEWGLKMLAGVIPVIIGIIGVVLTSGSTQTIIGVPTLMAGMWALGCLFMLYEFSTLQKTGPKLALSLHQNALEREGFDTFWSNLDIDDMRREVGAQA